MRLLVRGGRRLEGAVVVPPDKSILHRALLFAALGRGVARVHPLGTGADNRSTLSALASLGVESRIEGDVAVLTGVEGPMGLKAPSSPVDCGNSGTTMRLLTGVAAASPGLVVTLDGDASLRRRPMARLLPLEAMGARLVGRGPDRGRLHAPFEVHGAALRGAVHVLPVPSAQVKSALLLAGLYAEGTTRVTEPRTSRDHTERMLASRGVAVARAVAADGSHSVSIEPLARPWSVADARVPPDVSSATFLLAAAAVTGGRVAVRSGVNPTRMGGPDALTCMGLDLAQTAPTEEGGEPVATLEVRGPSPLRGIAIRGDLALRAIDELPVLAGVAVYADGMTVIADAQELRVKESDRIAEVVRILTAFGARAEARPDGLVVDGGRRLVPARVDSAGDHRIAMTAAIVALGIEGESSIEGAEAIDVSFPGFVDALRGLGADVAVEP